MPENIIQNDKDVAQHFIKSVLEVPNETSYADHLEQKIIELTQLLSNYRRKNELVP